MDESNFPEIKMEISTLCDAASQVLEFYDATLKKQKVVLATDYSLVSGFVRPRKPHSDPTARGFDRDIDHVGRRIFQLYREHHDTTPYTFAFSEPTIMEFRTSTDRLKKEIRTIESNSLDGDQLYDAFMRFIERNGEISPDQDSALYVRAHHAFETLKRVFDEAPLNSLLTLIRNGHVNGFGNYFSRGDFNSVKKEVYATTRTLWEFLNEHKKASPNQPYNNLIDALNFAMAYHLDGANKKVNLAYVAPFPSAALPPELRPVVGHRAIPASVLLDLSARHFMAGQANMDDEVRDWIIDCFDAAGPCREILRDRSSASELTNARKRRIHLLYRDYLIPTFRNGREKGGAKEVFEDAKNLFSDKASFRKRFEAGQDLANKADAALDSLEPVIGSEELMSDLGLMDDPKFQAIRKRLGSLKP